MSEKPPRTSTPVSSTPIATTPIASKWNARYAYANNALPEPAAVLVNGTQFLPTTGVALDLACGRGGNAFYLGERGLSVHAWDISKTAIDWIVEHQSEFAEPGQLFPEVRDVIAKPPPENSFDVIVVSRFLERSLCAGLVDALKPDGVIFYQTFTAGLSNPDYLLQSNELPELFCDLQECCSSESPIDQQGRSEAYFIGKKVG